MHLATPQLGILTFCVLVASLAFHEFAHAWMAWRLGDGTAHAEGRLSLNPLDHLDPLGTVMMLWIAFHGIGLGWAKPVPVNPWNFRNPRRSMMWVAFAGPLSNLFLAVIGWIGFEICVRSGAFMYLGSAVERILLDLFMPTNNNQGSPVWLSVNFGLFLFNMIPLVPLDGSKILPALLPRAMGDRVEERLYRWGVRPLLALIVLIWVLGSLPI